MVVPLERLSRGSYPMVTLLPLGILRTPIPSLSFTHPSEVNPKFVNVDVT